MNSVGGYMATIRANNPVLRNRRIKRQAELDVKYSFEFECNPIYNSMLGVLRICEEVIRPAIIEAGKALQKCADEYPTYFQQYQEVPKSNESVVDVI